MKTAIVPVGAVRARLVTLTLDPSRFTSKEEAKATAQDHLPAFIASAKRAGLFVDSGEPVSSASSTGWPHIFLITYREQKLSTDELKDLHSLWALGRVDVRLWEGANK